MERQVRGYAGLFLVGASLLALWAPTGRAQEGLRTAGRYVIDTTWSAGTYAQVEAGGDTTFGLRPDGSLVGWGRNDEGLPLVPDLPPGLTYVDVDVGGWSAAARVSDGTWRTWGAGWIQSCVLPTLPPGAAYVQIRLGSGFLVALASDGTVAACGENKYGQSTVPGGLAGAVAVTAGHQHAAALLSDGSIVAWGRDQYGQTSVPALPPGIQYVQVAAGSAFTAARCNDGSIVVWGSNVSGQCNVPALPVGLSYTALDAHHEHCLALRSDGELLGWGENGSGQVTIPAAPPGRAYVSFSAGRMHSAALLDDGSLLAWGSNLSGQCGLPKTPAGVRYTAIRASDGFDIMVPFGHLLALRSDGVVLAMGTQGNVPSPPLGTEYVGISAGGEHSLALLSDGTATAWGQNWFGQSTPPSPPPPGTSYVEVAAGGSHSLARRSDGAVIAWGDNSKGQCNVPNLPPGVTYVQLDASGYFISGPYNPETRGFTLARTSDGAVLAWGSDELGQSSPPPLPAGVACVQVAAGARHGLGLLADGSVISWGDNMYGQCNVPTLPLGLSYVEVSAGQYGSAARRSDGSLVAWGSFYGQFHLPPPPSGSSWVEIAAASDLTLLRYAPDGDVTRYCTAKPSSIPGCVPALQTAGAPSASAGSGFYVTAAPLPGKCLGIFFYTTQGAAAVPVQNAFGYLCTAPSGTFRLQPALGSGGTKGSCNGRLQVDFNAFFATQSQNPALVAGARVDLQAWYRDPSNPGGANLTDAVAFMMVP